MEKWNRALNMLMGTSIVVTLTRIVVDYIDLMILRPEIYAIRSAPWYTAGLLYCAITFVVLLVCIVIKIIIKHKLKKKD